jgi:hypothetical protein
VHQENAERMLLATFVAGLTGTPGRQVRHAIPQTVQQALQIAISVQEAESKNGLTSFYRRFENSVNLHPRSPCSSGSDNETSSHSGAMHAPSTSNGQRSSLPRKERGQSDRNTPTKAALRCYECIRHFDRECPTMFTREGDSYAPQKPGQTERSKRSGPTDSKPTFQRKRESSTRLEKSGKGKEA